MKPDAIPSEYAQRRRRLAEAIGDGVAVIPTALERLRNRDSHYPYRFDSHFYYLTGFAEPEAVGEPDAYGHRHKADVGEALAEELKRRTGVETVHSDLTYDLRSGDPDALDQLVAITYANIAVDLLADAQFGRMVAVRDGNYEHAPLPDRREGARHIDVPTMYNLERFRPRYEAKLGSPLLLGAAVVE